MAQTNKDSSLSELVQSSPVYNCLKPFIQCVTCIPTKTWVGIGLFALLAAYKKASSKWIPSNTVLEIDFRDVMIRETMPNSSSTLFGLLPSPGVNVHTLVRTIIKASKDQRITGLVINLDTFQATLTEMQEIRDAVVAFRAAGKKTLCYSSTFSESGQATMLYWFASAFEEIYMPSIGNISFVGLKVQTPFLRQMLDKLSTKALLVTRRRYKTMANTFTEDKYTDEHKETMDHIVNTIHQSILKEIAEGRGLSLETTKQLMIDGPFMAEKAVELKLVTGIAYEDEFYDNILPAKFAVERGLIGTLWNKLTTSNQVPKGVNLTFADKFFKKSGGSPYKHGKSKVALVNIIGTIHRGKSELEWDGSETSAGSETIVAAIRQATNDKKVKAILIRVASGGGSAVASEEITRAVLNAKAAGKKIIVSMAQYAASGGYYVSCHADKIVASPLTLTGSIGVVAGKFNFKDTWSKVGITFDSVQTSNNADMNDSLASYDEENKGKLDSFIDDLYLKFKQHVATGRKLSMEKVEELAQGRVWMGAAALEHGLVDALGGMETAISLVKQELGLKETDTLKIVKYPLASSFLESLKPANNSRELPRSGAVASWFLPSSLSQSMSTIALAWRTLNMISTHSTVRAALQTMPLCDFSDPSQVVMQPSFVTPDANLSI